jgi:hypothetical protein
MMIAGGSTYFLLAWVVVAAMGVVGLGLLFVRAENIERVNLVSGSTLLFSAIGALLLWNATRSPQGAANSVAWSAIALSIFGFGLGRVLDLILGARNKVHRDEATLGSDLAD